MVSIILAHPWHGSFNKAICDTITSKLDEENKPYTVLDLNKDNFNPVLTANELAIYSKGEYTDPLVGHYQTALKNSDEVIFIFPIWWNSAPAILRGFFDKVFLVNFSHTYENGWTPLLNINKTLVVTTSQSPTEHFATSIESLFIKENLGVVGFKNVKWLNCDNVKFGTDEHRKHFLQEVSNNI